MRTTVDLPLFLPLLESGACIVTPGKRLAREITESWVRHCESGSPVIDTPRVTTVDSWLEQAWSRTVEAGRLPPSRLLTPQQDLAVWQQLIRSDLEERVGFSLTHPRAAAQRAQAAWNKLMMHDGAGLKDLWSAFQYDDDCQVFSEWAQRYSARLSELGVVSRYGAYQQLLSLAVTERPTVGLFTVPDLPPLTRKALDHLASVTLIEPERGDPADLPVQSCVTRDDELFAAAQWARASSAGSGQRVGIVVLDMANDRNRLEYFLRQEFDCLDARYNDLPVNFATGMPLATTPLFRDALVALEWEVHPLGRTGWLSLTRSPYLAFKDEREMVPALIQAQFLSGSHEVSLENTLHVAARLNPESRMTGILRAIRSSRAQKGVKNLDDWTEVIRERLALWGWPGRPGLDSIEYQQFQRLDASLDALASLAGVLPHQSYESALALWRDCLAATVFQPKTPHDSIQVLGPLEAVGARFDALWICGAQRGVLPARPRVEPFLPAAVQKSLGMADIDESALIEEASTLLEVWFAGSREVIASFHSTEQGLPQHASALLSGKVSEADTAWFPPARWARPLQVEPTPEDPSLPLETPETAGGSSLIRDQAACPFRAFARHRLNLPSLQPTVIGISASERGAFLHEALFRLWRQIESSDALTSLSPEAEQNLIEDAVSSAMQQIESACEARGYSLRERVGSACWQLEQQLCVDLLAQWLGHERERSASFRVVEMEQNQTLQVEGLSLTLRPDRIDEFEDGRRAVIDYKTRAPSKTRWLGERPQEPQLPLYSLLDPKIQGIAFAELPATDPVQFIALGEDLGLTKGDNQSLEQQTRSIAATWPELVAQWEASLQQLAREFMAGEAAVSPQSGACDYCDLASLCRINEFSANTDAAALEEPA
jgi:ATP-dependent helicase/nuclease subunit B